MPEPTSFGQQCAAALKEAKRANPNLSWEAVSAIIQAQYDSMHTLTLTSDEPAAPRMSKRDQYGELFEALCTACGMTTTEMTRPARGRVGKAVSEIRAATPTVTPEEIKRRVALYRRKYSSMGASGVTPTAIASHWHEFGQGDKTETAKADIYQEPPNWREILEMRGLPGVSSDALREMLMREWSDIRVSFGPQILSRIR